MCIRDRYNLGSGQRSFIAHVHAAEIVQNGLRMESLLFSQEIVLEKSDRVHNAGVRYATGGSALALYKAYIVKQECRPYIFDVNCCSSDMWLKL